ncbi:MAG: recombination regulator RecX [bacterium]|nr:recombination regulator RecX [bacterium]
MWTSAEEESFRARALRILEGRFHSRRELGDKLRARGCPRELLEYLLERFSETGLLNDDAFARAFAESKINAGWGQAKIRNALFAKGISQEIIVSVCGDAELFAEDKAYEQALRLAEKSRRKPETLYRFLIGRGFSSDCVRKVLASVNFDADDGSETRADFSDGI